MMAAIDDMNLSSEWEEYQEEGQLNKNLVMIFDDSGCTELLLRQNKFT